MPSIIEKAKELRATGLSAMDALRQARQEIIPPKAPGTTSPNTTPLRPGFNYGTDGGGGDDSAPSVNYEGVVVDSGMKGDIAYTPVGTVSAYASPTVQSAPPAQRTVTTNSSPSVGGGSTPASKKTTPKSDTLDATLKTDITNTYADTKTQNEKVLEEQKKAEEDAAAATVANLEAEKLQKESAAIDENERQKARAAEDARIQQEVDARYREKQQAELASLKAKQESEERKLAIDNDVAQQSSAVAFAKLGLSLSTAGITTAQQIFTTGAYNLAKLKTENAYQYADLQEQVAKTEFEHTNAVNKIIRESEDKTYTIRKALNEEVYKIKNSIIKTTLDKKNAIAKATDAYLKARDANEKDTLKKMQDRADLVKKENDAIYDVLKKKEEYANTHIATLVSSGRWDILPDSEKVKLEKLAGVPFGTTDMQTKAALGKLLYKQAEEITGLKGITFGVGEYQKILQDATFFKSQGLGPEDAMNRALDSYIRKSPEMQAKMRELAKKGTSGGGGGGTATSKSYATGQLISFEDPTGASKDVQTAEYHAGKGDVEGYVVSGGVKIPFSKLKKVTTPKPAENDDY